MADLDLHYMPMSNKKELGLNRSISSSVKYRTFRFQKNSIELMSFESFAAFTFSARYLREVRTFASLCKQFGPRSGATNSLS